MGALRTTNTGDTNASRNWNVEEEEDRLQLHAARDLVRVTMKCIRTRTLLTSQGVKRLRVDEIGTFDGTSGKIASLLWIKSERTVTGSRQKVESCSSRVGIGLSKPSSP
jgi:hypothetical protein